MLTPELLQQLLAEPLTKRNRLQRARELAGLTQVELAARLDATQPYISDLENGNYVDVKLENGRRFARFFRMSVEELFPATDEVVQ